MKEESYNKIRIWFLTKKERISALRLLYRSLPFVMVGFYILCLIVRYVQGGFWDFFYGALIPGAFFIATTLFRYWKNSPRPYEKYKIEPLIPKNKKGQSFPSRHVASAAIIAMSWLPVNAVVWAILMVVALLIALTRVFAGVHSIVDVTAGYLCAVVVGLLFFT